MSKRPNSFQEQSPKKLKTSEQPLSAAQIQERIEKAKASLAQNQSAIREQGKGGVNVGLHPLLTAQDPLQAIPRANVATLKANQRIIDHRIRVAMNSLKKPSLKIEKAPADFADPSKNPYFDPKLQAPTGPKERFNKQLKFAPQGKFISQANQFRQEQHLEKLKETIALQVRKAGMEAEMDLVADSSLRTQPPPEVEWWDSPLLINCDYSNPIDYNIVSAEGETLITNLIQHPIPIQPLDMSSQVPQIVILTKKERKKIRRQRRLEALKEKQDKQKLGLLPPDKPKVKIANLMRVLGNEAIQDPTQIEVQVRKEMAERQKKHEEHNASAKLTEEERKEKKASKLQEDSSQGVHVAVFRIKNLDHPHYKFKVNKNAQQYNLSGTGIIYPTFNLVIVEGGPKGIKQYKNLLLKRMDWNKFNETDDLNECHLVWEGVLVKSSFRGFRLKNVASETLAKDFLENHGVVHYWNAAKNFVAKGL